MENRETCVAIITPTLNRKLETIERCIASVLWQQGISNVKVRQIICTDGGFEDQVQALVNELKTASPSNIKLEYCCTGVPTNSFGGGVRHHVMENILRSEIESSDVQFVCHLDDDNILYPHFIKNNLHALTSSPHAMFAICRIIHMGPLPQALGEPPQILKGIPPVLRNIDTLQVFARAEAMLRCGWDHHSGDMGYYNDGFTYERLGKMFSYVEVPEILAIHV